MFKIINLYMWAKIKYSQVLESIVSFLSFALLLTIWLKLHDHDFYYQDFLTDHYFKK